MLEKLNRVNEMRLYWSRLRDCTQDTALASAYDARVYNLGVVAQAIWNQMTLAERWMYSALAD